jgi:hypothetical protein
MVGLEVHPDPQVVISTILPQTLPKGHSNLSLSISIVVELYDDVVISKAGFMMSCQTRGIGRMTMHLSSLIKHHQVATCHSR